MAKAAEFNKAIKDLSTEDLKARILEDKQRLKKVEFAPEVPNISADAPKEEIKEETPEIKKEIKKQESNRWQRMSEPQITQINGITQIRQGQLLETS